MAYEYEYEGKNMMAGVYSSLATNESVKELEEVYAKAKAWQKLKEEMKQDYNVTKQVNDEMALRDLALLDDYLRRIDELDGTNEFSNLLSDLEDE
ncbi:hypothetical protein [Mammaliicoccus lentus]|uniref:Uncharacterized protein n=1 Tax=Mammaliicoccus lentus TaxID=42858 RepID=A0ABS6GT35_MAMLE|nr:hypothetical protein [Mammaliicoccus lentus]MBU6112519.1 hypothetical protein [Mammaliicoccus lentus]